MILDTSSGMHVGVVLPAWGQHSLGLLLSAYLIGVAVDYIGRLDRDLPQLKERDRLTWQGAIAIIFRRIPASLLWFWPRTRRPH